MRFIYQTIGYDLTRRSNREYTHAVVFNNTSVISNAGNNVGYGATWHTSLKLAEASAKQINRYAHLELIGIVEVEAK